MHANNFNSLFVALNDLLTVFFMAFSITRTSYVFSNAPLLTEKHVSCLVVVVVVVGVGFIGHALSIINVPSQS